MREYQRIGIGTGHLYTKEYPKILEFFRYVFNTHASAEKKILVDTAEDYGNGQSEFILGRVIHETCIPRKHIFIASKVLPGHLHKADVKASCKASIKRMGCEYIDLYQIHWSNPTIDVSEALEAMNELHNEGLIRYIGVCNFSVKELKAVLSQYKIDSLQMEYNLNNTLLEETHLQLCIDNGIQIIAYSPLDRGVLKYNKGLSVLTSIANKTNKTIEQIALSYLLQSDIVSCIPETISIEHFNANAASDFKLDFTDTLKIYETFKAHIIGIFPDKIGVGKTWNYTSLEEVKHNIHHLCPSPAEIAKHMLMYGMLKPIKIAVDGDRYQIVEGASRYWANILAYGNSKKMPCIIVTEI